MVLVFAEDAMVCSKEDGRTHAVRQQWGGCADGISRTESSSLRTCAVRGNCGESGPQPSCFARRPRLTCSSRNRCRRR
jgi:hypothetical protein